MGNCCGGNLTHDVIVDITGYNFLPEKLINSGGEEVDSKLAKNVYLVLLFFSANYCNQSKLMLPTMLDYYKEWNKDLRQIEFIYVSLDKKDEDFNSHFTNTQPLFAIHHSNKEFIKDMKTKFNVVTPPDFVVMNRKGEVVSDSVKYTFTKNKKDDINEWLMKK